MQRIYKILLIGLLTIGLFDTFGSIASRQFDLSYTIFAPVSFLIYAFFGFMAAKESGLKTGVLVSAAVGLFDSTIGWKISMLLNANTGDIKIRLTVLLWVITVILVTGTAALCGLIGGGLAVIIKRRKA
jgi:hypothetical protein